MDLQRIKKWLSFPVVEAILWLGLPLVIGILVATMIPRPAIGIVSLRDAIYDYSASQIIAELRYAYDHPEVSAVVLIMESPGGTVADTESIYLELLRLREKKPVVTVIESMSASGGYYLAVGTDFIFAKASSLVGNVGVITSLPPPPAVYEDTISTGPYKLTASTRDSFLRILDPMKQAFYQAVVKGRGKALKASADDILSGKIYIGSEALRLGLVDALGDQSDAINKAASLAHVWNYRTLDLFSLAWGSKTNDYLFYKETEDGTITAYPRKPGMYYLYIPPEDRSVP
jgi:protease-4